MLFIVRHTHRFALEAYSVLAYCLSMTSLWLCTRGHA
jgi:hypothetical protein